ncbi:hypothetical protein [Cytobacillus gottheilii]|nr:hypothetical protein [Cytobacillus gottheilii]
MDKQVIVITMIPTVMTSIILLFTHPFTFHFIVDHSALLKEFFN